jgi:hypothetical protein
VSCGLRYSNITQAFNGVFGVVGYGGRKKRKPNKSFTVIPTCPNGVGVAKQSKPGFGW